LPPAATRRDDPRAHRLPSRFSGRGPLKTTMDVINAAKKISEAGTQLDKFTRMIAEQCPESTTKKDLLAYLQRIALYCHQLNITSKVKADVQNISGELIVSGVGSLFWNGGLLTFLM